MGFPSQSKKRERIKSILLEHDIVARGDYRSGRLSRKYILTRRAIDALKEPRDSASA